MTTHASLEWQFHVATIPALAAGILTAALAVIFLRVRNGRRDVLALALLLTCEACALLIGSAARGFTHTYPAAVGLALAHAFETLDGWLWACFAMMLLAERTRLPRVLRAFPTYVVPGLAVAALGVLLPHLVYDFSGFVDAGRVADAPPEAWPFAHPQPLVLVDHVSDLAMPVFALVLAWWALRREGSDQWSSILLIALAAVAASAFHSGELVARRVDGLRTATSVGDILGGVTAVIVLGLLGLLLHAGVRGRDERRRLARIGIAFLLLMVGTGVWISLAPTTPLTFSTFVAVVTLTFPVVATYALLRHRLLGLDVKLRFAISRSTIAAAFVATFFIASEGAQIVFGQGNEWVGLFAAGALVFAMAPLQRAAERLAERAVPIAPQAPGSDGSRLDVYRHAVGHALRGRAIAREEEAYLADLATHLGIDYRTALRVRREVEAERETSA